MSVDQELVRLASRTATERAVAQLQVVYHRRLREELADLLDWRVEDGADELRAKVGGIKADLDSLVGKLESHIPPKEDE